VIGDTGIVTELSLELGFFVTQISMLDLALAYLVIAVMPLLNRPRLEKEGQSYPDPIHGHIILPIWLVDVLKEKTVRRMLFIRQLGLKAYIDFPGAIHTRYSHAIGCMQLAGKVADLLVKKERVAGNDNVATTLENNRINLMAAGFFHDLGHGPFSHAVDFVMKKLTGKSHEDISTHLLDSKELGRIEQYGGLAISSVKQIMTANHPFPFLNGIVNGPLDVDKLDYLLRDSYHVGLKYSFDLDHFIDTYKVLGSDAALEECELGLERTTEARTTAEIFLIIWKNMYELVYNKERSRIAEKMLEKAILLGTTDGSGSDLKDYFTDIGKYVTLHDELLLEKLKESSERPRKLAEMIEAGTVYSILLDEELKASEKLELSDVLLDDLAKKDEAEVADKLTALLTTKIACERYEVICDIVKGRVPRPIHMNDPSIRAGEEEPPELKEDSDIVRAIIGRNRIKVYAEPSKRFDKDALRKHLNEILSTWS
jgi:HD superfamily phosphohydrolase